MSRLKEVLREKIESHRPRFQKLLKEHGQVVIDKVTIEQVIGGARDVRCLVSDISYLDPMEGIRFRGKTIPETFAALPRVGSGEYPCVEAFWYFLLTGDVPTKEDVKHVREDFQARSEVPNYVFDTLRAMARDSHPMALLSAAVLSMQRESVFVKRYNQGMRKTEYWDPMFEDSMNLLAKLPADRRLHLPDEIQGGRDRFPRTRISTWAATSPT